MGKPGGLCVAVRADNRQAANLRIEAPRDRAGVMVSGEKPVLVEQDQRVLYLSAASIKCSFASPE